MRIALVFSLLLSVVAVLFALQNPQTIQVNFIVYETSGSAALVLIVTFAIGVVVGLLSTLPGRIRDRRALKKTKRKLERETSPSESPPAVSDSPGDPTR
jgi:putative membrane protein